MRCCIEPEGEEGSLGAWYCTGNMQIHWEKAATAHLCLPVEWSRVRSQPEFVNCCQHWVASKPARVLAAGVDCTSAV